MEEQMNNPTERKKKVKKTITFGQENVDFIKRDFLKECVKDPIESVQKIIEKIHFNVEHPEYFNIRLIEGESDFVEIYIQDSWVKRTKQMIYNKLIYKVCDILEYNVPKKYWTKEFTNFISGMGQIDNDELLKLILEEVDNTIVTKSHLHIAHADN